MNPSLYPPYTCPVCGYSVFEGGPGSYAICPICYWEDDESQLRFVHRVGANGVSLIEAQRNYASFGASESRFVAAVREPVHGESRDANWRAFDLQTDEVQTGVALLEESAHVPDGTALYYWLKPGKS